MATIVSTAVRVGSYEYEQAAVKGHVERWLNGAGVPLQRALASFDRTLVQRRTSVEPVDFVFGPRGLGQSNDRYKHHASDLATQAVAACLEEADVPPRDIDLLISTSCTGIMIPSVDAVIAGRLGMKSSLQRLPITEHGCAGGAVALSLAHDHLTAYPDHRVVVVSVELPSLTFQPGDRSASNVISAALFGDGAAAVLLGTAPQPGHPRIRSSASHQFADSLDWMGFDLRDSGLHIVLSPRIPRKVREEAPPLIREFLAAQGLRVDQIQHFLFHPGGRKIVEAFEETLELSAGALTISRRVLTEHGNLSSATVLFILREYLQHGIGAPGDRGLMVAFGPGFSAQLLLLEWD